MSGKSRSTGRKSAKKISVYTVMVFLLTLTLCLSLVGVTILNSSRVESLSMEQLILEKSIRINDVISKLLYKTQMLSSLVLHGNGELKDFEQIAAIIVDDPAILNILIAPEGVVSDVYPLEGNEAVIGLNFFAEGAGNKEALIAKETGQLVLGGPFYGVQGEQVLVGRLPVFINGADGVKSFWGLVSVTLKYPQALEGAGLSELQSQGLAYEIWRINPDNNERQIISNSGHSYNRRAHFIEKHIPIMNADWYFRILSVRAWYESPATWALILVSICISLLVAAVIQNNQDLKALQDELETRSNTDPLTGISNRRYFMASAVRQMDKVIRMNSKSFMIMLDLDHFKGINDRYGHQAGDLVLQEVAARITNTLRSYDLFARFGGEEFIIFVADLGQPDAINLAERIRLNIASPPVSTADAQITVTASFGIAPAAPENDLETAIAFADSALYQAKSGGRNTIMFYEHEATDDHYD